MSGSKNDQHLWSPGSEIWNHADFFEMFSLGEESSLKKDFLLLLFFLLKKDFLFCFFWV